MENQNFVNVSFNLNTAEGKAMFLAIAAVLGGAITSGQEIEVKEGNVKPLKSAAKAAAPKSAPAAAEKPADTATPTSGETTPEPKAAAPKAAAPAPAAKAAAPAPAAKAAAPKAVAAKPTPAAAPKAVDVAFEDLDGEAQLESLKAYVTKFTKKGKSADIKALLAPYGAGKVSELEADSYVDFNAVLDRYAGGESVADIFPEMD